MPIYEYYCSQCEDRVEVLFLSIAEAAERSSGTPCPECGGTTLERVPSTVGRWSVASAGSAAGERAAAGRSAGPESSPDLAQRMRKASSVEPDRDFHEVASRLDRGENPASIEASLRGRVGEKMQPH